MTESTDYTVIPAHYQKVDTFPPNKMPSNTNSMSPSSRSTSISKAENVVQVRIIPKPPQPSGEKLGTE